jgi:cellulose synthase/poly-beta-1,6-N-acetylglucosamine synthase-like glycosyltransferase
MDGSGKPQRVAVCIASYRPRGLHALLGALDAQRFEAERPDIALVVADNDPAESARRICDDARSWLSLPLRYVVEPHRGIPFARNASVRAAGDADWLAFIDDDEIPEPDWLATLLAVQRTTDADLVTGPVLARFEVEPAPWLLEGGFFATPRRPTGTPMLRAYTGNTLLRARCLDAEFVHFDERLTQGSDYELSSRLAARGFRIVWADDAIVWESVPRERACASYVVRRAVADGSATTHIERFRRGALRAGAHAVAHGIWCMAKGFALAARHAFAAGRRVRALELAGFGTGRIAGALSRSAR